MVLILKIKKYSFNIFRKTAAALLSAHTVSRCPFLLRLQEETLILSIYYYLLDIYRRSYIETNSAMPILINWGKHFFHKKDFSLNPRYTAHRLARIAKLIMR
jgi:hypothetical protein